VVALIAVVGAVVAFGTAKWQQDPLYHLVYGSVAAPVVQVIAAAVPAPLIVD
jgi:hypothetical protein